MRQPSRFIGPVVAACLISLAAVTAIAQRGSPGPTRRAEPGPGQEAPKPTPQQIENLNRRIELVIAIVSRFEPQAKSQGRAEGWRRATLESLLALPLARLEQLEMSRDVDDLAAGIAAPVDAPTASPLEDLAYTPIVPCRFVDTRNVGGRVSGTRAFSLGSAGDVYGGAAACHLPTLLGLYAVWPAVAMNVTIVDPQAAPGFLAVKPTLAAPISSLLNWYQSGPSVQIANQSIVSMDVSGSAAGFVVQTSADVHVIIDLFGIFLSPALRNSGQKICVGTGTNTFSTHLSAPDNWTPRICSDWVSDASGIGTGFNSFFQLGCVFTNAPYYSFGDRSFRICDAPGPYCAPTSPNVPPSAIPSRNCGW